MKFIHVRIPEAALEELLNKWPKCSDYELVQRSVLECANALRKRKNLPRIELTKRGRKKKEARIFTEMHLDDIAIELGITQKEVIDRCDQLLIKFFGGRVSAEGAKQLLT